MIHDCCSAWQRCPLCCFQKCRYCKNLPQHASIAAEIMVTNLQNTNKRNSGICFWLSRLQLLLQSVTLNWFHYKICWPTVGFKLICHPHVCSINGMSCTTSQCDIYWNFYYRINITDDIVSVEYIVLDSVFCRSPQSGFDIQVIFTVISLGLLWTWRKSSMTAHLWWLINCDTDSALGTHQVRLKVYFIWKPRLI